MSIPITPPNLFLQTGDGNNFCSWDVSPTATTYTVQRSTDGVNFTTVATLTGATFFNSYLDNGYDAINFPSGPLLQVQYWYQVSATNGSGTSAYAQPVPGTPPFVIPTAIGKISLGQLRYQAQSRCDRINSQFVSLPEWNMILTEARKSLYNIITECYGGDYYSNSTYTITTGSGTQQYPLPKDMFKPTLIEVALNPSDPSSWVTLRRFNWIQKNLWNYPNVYTFYGITNLRYRLMGDNLYIVPIPSGGQTIRINYVPRPKTLMIDTDIVDGISGFEEYIINYAAMVALNKEESETAENFAGFLQKIIDDIMSAAENRDIGEPSQVSDSKQRNFSWGDPGEGEYGGSGNGM